jgi:hypothetical protein
VPLKLAAAYSASEFERIKGGFLPREMEDKWAMFFEEPWLFVYRSWSGFCTYGVRFESSAEGGAVVEAWVSRDPEQNPGTDIHEEARLLTSLIDAFLLKKEVGSASPDSGERKRTLWQRIRDRFK